MQCAPNPEVQMKRDYSTATLEYHAFSNTLAACSLRVCPPACLIGRLTPKHRGLISNTAPTETLSGFCAQQSRSRDHARRRSISRTRTWSPHESQRVFLRLEWSARVPSTERRCFRNRWHWGRAASGRGRRDRCDEALHVAGGRRFRRTNSRVR